MGIVRRGMKERLNLDGLFSEPVGCIKPKRRRYDNNYYILRSKSTLSIPDPSPDPIVVRKKKAGRPKSECKIKVEAERRGRPPKIEEPKLPKIKEPKPPKVVMAPRQCGPAEKPSPPQDEIVRVAHVIKELNRRRSQAILDPREDD